MTSGAPAEGTAHNASVAHGGAAGGVDSSTPEFAAEEAERLRGKLSKLQGHVKATKEALADAERRAKRG